MIRGEATATLADGRTLTLAVNFRVIASAAADTCIPATEIFSVLENDDGRQMKAMFALTDGALKKYHRDIGPDELDRLLLSDSQAISTALGEALSGAFPSDSDEKADEGNVKAGTSTRSKGTGRKRA